MLPRIPRHRTAIAILAFGLSAGTAVGQTQSEPTPVHSNRPVTSPGNAQWATTAEEARARATADSKLVYYEFDGEACGNCRRMQSLLYPAFDFEALLIGMVPVKLSQGSPDAKPLEERYGITETPSVLITTPEGRLVFLMQGFQDAPDFYGHAHKDLDAYRQFAKKLAQPVDKLSADEALAIARGLYDRRDPAAARPYLKRAATAPNPGPGVRETALEGLATVEFDAGDAAAARKTIDKLIATTKNPDQKERAELFRAQIPLSQNKPAEALALYKQFVKDHPDSKYNERVQSFIARLEPAPSP
jgi:tetratricopeptide (TPR) repeat protein